MGSDRGEMYDFQTPPREGCVTYSDDGYPKDDSLNFGDATDKQQRDVPRAFLRNAVHEMTHTLNQIHPDMEGQPEDNSIMSETGDVADVIR